LNFPSPFDLVHLVSPLLDSCHPATLRVDRPLLSLAQASVLADPSWSELVLGTFWYPFGVQMCP
jgi:hypothetical protein